MTGWTVCDKLSEITSMSFLLLVDLLNTAQCGELLYSEMNTYLNKLNNVIMSSTWGKSAWVFICKILLNSYIYLISKINSENPSETKRSEFPSGLTDKNRKKRF